MADPVDDLRRSSEITVADRARRVHPWALDRSRVEHYRGEFALATEVPEHPGDVDQRRKRGVEGRLKKTPAPSELGGEFVGLVAVLRRQRDGGASAVSSRLRLRVRVARECGRPF